MTEEYTFDRLLEKTPQELSLILGSVQSKLAEVQKKKFALCGRIMFYQNTLKGLENSQDDSEIINREKEVFRQYMYLNKEGK